MLRHSSPPVSPFLSHIVFMHEIPFTCTAASLREGMFLLMQQRQGVDVVGRLASRHPLSPPYRYGKSMRLLK